MSRSFKKHGYIKWCGGNSDKWDRTLYSRSRRRKDKAICKECTNFPFDFLTEDDNLENIPSDKIVKNGVDYSVSNSDKYSWSSDGGSYFSDDLSSLRKEFNKEIFGIDKRNVKRNSWEDYLSNREKVFNKDKPTWRLVVSRKVVKEYVPDLFSWDGYFPLFKEEKKYITLDHKPTEKDIPEGWEMVDFWKQKKHYSFGNWFLMDYVFEDNLIPLNFKTSDEMIDWFRENQEDILKKWLKARLLRK